MADLPIYVLERVFDAPRELVWKTWTDAELLTRWYGPRVETTVHRLDLEPDGLWLVEMQWGGNSNYQRVEYTEVTRLNGWSGCTRFRTRIGTSFPIP